ncbi:MAG: TerB N-terminal domain-containing protein [Clostridia bacterium]|nr:TerB N-terminal domain-containing protein [Clostridia bacterium]
MIFKHNNEKLKKHCRIAETDRFWDIEEITPAKKTPKKQNVFSSVDAVEVCEKSDERVFAQGFPIPREKVNGYSSEFCLEYSPENSLVKSVGIYTWPMKYMFYERFRIDARKYFNVSHGEVQPVKYYSYMPGYVQMSLSQRRWYFYWRDCVRKNIYLPTDSSYILLYVYEIINLPELIPVEKGLSLMCDIWEKYRESYTKLDKYMSEWVCDYCLINKLPFPHERIKGFLANVTEVTEFKQMYFSCEEGDVFSTLMLEKGSSYRWRKSKYIDENNAQIFEKHINAAFNYAIKKYASFDGRFEKENRIEEKTCTRDSFGGALCAYEIKRKIKLTYYDLKNDSDVGFIITDTVKYCENRVRAYLGIRARLNVQNLTEQHKNIINEYFEANLPAFFYEKKASKAKNEYEDVFVEEGVKPFEVSFEKAKMIEKESWLTTDRLTEDVFEEEVFEEVKDENKSIESESLDVAKSALICIYKGDHKGFSSIAEENYMMLETLAECVNELCFEILGDIGIEEKDGKYIVIPDYESEIKQWLKL